MGALTPKTDRVLVRSCACARRTRPGRPFRFPWRTRRSIAGDVDDEVRFHLDMRTAELVQHGMSEPMAREEAIREFGNIDFTKRYCRAQDQAGERDAME